MAIAKNYLAEDEMKALNLIVSAYLDFAELQALNRKPMHMADWIAKLDDFIRIAGPGDSDARGQHFRRRREAEGGIELEKNLTSSVGKWKTRKPTRNWPGS